MCSQTIISQSKTVPNFFFSQTGEASYYGEGFNNRKTSSGEIYNKNEFTAAHLFLAFGTNLKVTNLKNKKIAIVRVTDRGPSKKSRIIDLSYAAAKKLDFVKDGTAKVKIETLSEPFINDLKEIVIFDGKISRGEEYSLKYLSQYDSVEINKVITEDGNLRISLLKHENQTNDIINPPKKSEPDNSKIENKKAAKTNTYAVQVGAFINFNNADDLRQLMIQKKYNDVELFSVKRNDTTFYKVTIGNFQNMDSASTLKKKLLKDNIIGFTIMKGN